MKIADRLTVIFATFCLILLSVLIPVNVMITRDVYYRNQFKKCGIYPEDGNYVSVMYFGGESSQTAKLTNKQLDEIITHTTAYFNGEKDKPFFILDQNPTFDVAGGAFVKDAIQIPAQTIL